MMYKIVFKRNIIYLSFLFVIYSCTTNKYYLNNQLKCHKEDLHFFKCKLYAPLKSSRSFIDSTEVPVCPLYTEHESDCRNWNCDTCPQLYVSTFQYALNYENIKSSSYNDTILRMRSDPVGHMDDDVRPDTMDLHGIDENGRYWRDISYNLNTEYYYCVGYKNVPIESMLLYDKLIESVDVYEYDYFSYDETTDPVYKRPIINKNHKKW